MAWSWISNYSGSLGTSFAAFVQEEWSYQGDTSRVVRETKAISGRCCLCELSFQLQPWFDLIRFRLGRRDDRESAWFCWLHAFVICCMNIVKLVHLVSWIVEWAEAKLRYQKSIACVDGLRLTSIHNYYIHHRSAQIQSTGTSAGTFHQSGLQKSYRKTPCPSTNYSV